LVDLVRNMKEKICPIHKEDCWHTMRDVMQNKFANWKKKKSGRECLAVLFVECKGKCPKCKQDMVLSYEDKTYENRATWNHKVPLADNYDLSKCIENLEILCWKCNNEEGIKFNHEFSNRV